MLRFSILALFLMLATPAASENSAPADRPPPPDLTQEWASTWGNIVWWENRYGTGSDTLQYEEPVWDAERGAYVLQGFFGTRGGEANQGGIEFVFSDQCSFAGTWWWARSPNSRQPWTGQCTAPSAAVEEQVASTEPKAEGQSAEPTMPPPNLDQDFDMTPDGKLVSWSRDVVVSRDGDEEALSYEQPRWDPERSAWVITGTVDEGGFWARRFEFVFSDPCTLAGYYVLEGSRRDKKHDWSGACYVPEPEPEFSVVSEVTMDPGDPVMAPLWDRFGFTVALRTISFVSYGTEVSKPLIVIDRVKPDGPADRAGLLEDHAPYLTLSGFSPDTDRDRGTNGLEDYVTFLLDRLDRVELAFNQFPARDYAIYMTGKANGLWRRDYEQPFVGGASPEKVVLLLRPDIEQHIGLRMNGWEVVEVLPGSIAERALLQPGDRIRSTGARNLGAHNSTNQVLAYFINRLQVIAEAGNDVADMSFIPAGKTNRRDAETRALPARAFNPRRVDSSNFDGYFRNIENRFLFEVLMGDDWTFSDLPAYTQNAVRQLFVIYHNKYYDTCIAPYQNGEDYPIIPDEEIVASLSKEELEALILQTEAKLAEIFGRIVTVRSRYDPMTGQYEEESEEFSLDVQPDYAEQYVEAITYLRRSNQPFLAQGVFITRVLSTLAADVDAVLAQTGCISDDLTRLEQGLAYNAALDPSPVTVEDIQNAFPR